MKLTKAGLTIIEDDDKTPSAYDAIGQLWGVINVLRKEHNKTAELIDELQEQIDELKKNQNNR